MRKIIHSAVFLLISLACVPAAGQASTRSAYSAGTESQVRVLLNGIRHEHGLRSLSGSIALRNAARLHTSDMLKRGYFEHDSPTERFSTRIRHYLDSPLVGENIAWGTGSYGTAEGIVGMWMRSPAHRHVILMPSLHRVGLGVATGSFKGSRDAVMATADFSS